MKVTTFDRHQNTTQIHRDTIIKNNMKYFPSMVVKHKHPDNHKYHDTYSWTYTELDVKVNSPVIMPKLYSTKPKTIIEKVQNLLATI